MEDIHQKVSQKLEIKRIMHNNASRNRQRTITFAQSGGATSGGGGGGVLGRGLEVFAPHLLHSITDEVVNNGSEVSESEVGTVDEDGVESGPGPTTEGQGRQIGSARQLQQRGRSATSIATLNSRPASAIAFGDGIYDAATYSDRRSARARSARRSRPGSAEEKAAEARRMSILNEAMVLAHERISSGRHGPILKPVNDGVNDAVVVDVEKMGNRVERKRGMETPQPDQDASRPSTGRPPSGRRVGIKDETDKPKRRASSA
ncbi:hypothetical protein HK104_007953, partial [Borealophlyctis nickersoniae]